MPDGRSRIAEELASLRRRIEDLQSLETELVQAERLFRTAADSARTADQIRSEIEARLGFVPAFFNPAMENPEVLENLWRQSRSLFYESPLPPAFREKLLARLSRYCASPYAIVTASCRLHRLGLNGGAILSLLMLPEIEDASALEREADLLRPSALEQERQRADTSADAPLITCCAALFREPERAIRIAGELRRSLGGSTFDRLVSLLAFVRTLHLWLECHPEVTYESDPQVREDLVQLLREEPKLADLFHNYYSALGRDKQRHEAEMALQASEERYRELFENAIDMIYTLDLEGQLTSVNKAAERITGFSRGELINKKLADILAPESLDVARRMSQRQAAGEGRTTAELEVIAKTGQRVALEVSTRLIYREGKPAAVQGIARDVTERKRTEAALQQANQKLEAWVVELEQRTREMTLLSEMGDMLRACLTTDEAYSVIVRVAQQVFPVQVGALYVITPSRNLVEAVAVWGESALAERVFSPDECWALRRGRVHWVQNTEVALLCKHLHKPAPEGYLCVPMMAQSEALGVLHLAQPSNVSMNEAKQRLAVTMSEHIAMALSNLRLHETLRSQSIRDPLTGLFNRRFMEESLELELRRAGRNQRSLGVIMLDLDQFKHFNDSYGHEAGDTLLRELGALLQTNIRGEDIACRYGGEEFTLILPEGSAEVTLQRANALREAIKRLDVHHRNQAIGRVTVSMGVAIFPEHGRTGPALLQAADVALYHSKDLGRDRVTLAKWKKSCALGGFGGGRGSVFLSILPCRNCGKLLHERLAVVVRNFHIAHFCVRGELRRPLKGVVLVRRPGWIHRQLPDVARPHQFLQARGIVAVRLRILFYEEFQCPEVFVHLQAVQVIPRIGLHIRPVGFVVLAAPELPGGFHSTAAGHAHGCHRVHPVRCPGQPAACQPCFAGLGEVSNEPEVNEPLVEVEPPDPGIQSNALVEKPERLGRLPRSDRVVFRKKVASGAVGRDQHGVQSCGDVEKRREVLVAHRSAIRIVPPPVILD
jgi:diguanylate cyclase (GGDEF)-like protein/PAS domain S-box-containing protein